MAPTIDENILLNLSEAMGAFLSATIEAQAESARKTIEFIDEVGFEDAQNSAAVIGVSGNYNDYLIAKQRKLRMVEFDYFKKDENGVVQNRTIQMPLLALTEIPMLSISKATFKMAYTIEKTEARQATADITSTGQETSTQTEIPDVNNMQVGFAFYKGARGPQFLGRMTRRNVNVTGNVSESVTTDEKGSLEVEIELTRPPLPSGIERLVDLMEISATEQPKPYPRITMVLGKSVEFIVKPERTAKAYYTFRRADQLVPAAPATDADFDAWYPVGEGLRSVEPVEIRGGAEFVVKDYDAPVLRRQTESPEESRLFELTDYIVYVVYKYTDATGGVSGLLSTPFRTRKQLPQDLAPVVQSILPTVNNQPISETNPLSIPCDGSVDLYVTTRGLGVAYCWRVYNGANCLKTVLNFSNRYTFTPSEYGSGIHLGDTVRITYNLDNEAGPCASTRPYFYLRVTAPV